MSNLPVHANLEIVFANSEDDVRSAGYKTPVLAVILDRNTWNDYGHKLYADLFYISGKLELRSSIRIMFSGKESTAAFLIELFERIGPVVPASKVETPFCSLQKEVTAYRDLVENLGFDRAIVGLRGIGDSVLLKLEGTDRERLALVESAAFSEGMTRNSSEYFALRRGGQFLRRIPAPTVQDSAESFALTGIQPYAEKAYRIALDFEPDSLFQDRVCVLIGKNGVGKSQTIAHVIEGLMDVGDDKSDDVDSPVQISPHPSFRRVILFSSAATDAYPKSILPWLGIDYEWHAMASSDHPMGRGFMQSLVDCLRDDGYIGGDEDNIVFDRQALLADALDRLGIWKRLCVPLKPADGDDLFPASVMVGSTRFWPISRSLNEHRKIRLFNEIDWDKNAVVFDNDGNIRKLSSGEVAMAHFIAQAVASIESGSLFLFDEPETHLHPNYISEFMDQLQELMDGTKSVAIIATHSAYVVREVPRKRVNIYQRADDELTIVQPRIQTFGASIDSISQFVFGDTLISHRFQEVLTAWAIREGSEIGIDRIVDEYGSTLNPETLSLIATTIRNNKTSEG